MAQSGSPSDAELMERVRVDDRAAFGELYRRHERRVFAYLWRLLKDEAAAADLRQDTFVRFWRARRNWFGGSVAGYLIRIARNLAVDRARHSEVQQRWWREQKHVPEPSALPPDEAMEREWLAARVNAAVDDLPKRMYHVFVLKRDAGLSTREISELLGIAPKTVEAHMHAALKRLRSALSSVKEDTDVE